jgi:hypothetical protein
MQIIGISRRGSTAILGLSCLVLFCGTVGHFTFELDLATGIFIGLNLVAVYGLLRRDGRKHNTIS